MKKAIKLMLVTFMLLSVLSINVMAQENLGRIDPITDIAQVNGDNITVSDSTLDWYAADASIGRYQDGWWIVAKIIAPDYVTDDNVGMVKYSNNGTDTLDKDFGQNNDGKIGNNYYMGCWVPVKPEYLNNAINKGFNLTWTYKFDWNGDGVVDQTFNIVVNPNNITLKKDGEVWCQTVNGVMKVGDALADNALENTFGSSATDGNGQTIYKYENDNNKSTENESLNTVLGSSSYVKVVLTDSTYTQTTDDSGAPTIEVLSATFDVTPNDSTNDIHGTLSGSITFRLPVDNKADYRYADVYHEGTRIGQYEVKTEGTTKYIEVSYNQFSVYKYILTNTQYVAPSTGGGSGSSISRKPVVNTSAK